MGANYSLLLVGYMGGEIDLWVCSINIKSRYYVWSLESWSNCRLGEEEQLCWLHGKIIQGWWG